MPTTPRNIRTHILVGIIFLILLLVNPGWAEENPPELLPPAQVEETVPAVVLLDGGAVFTVRSAATGMTTTERAKRISERLRLLAADMEYTVEDLEIEPLEGNFYILKAGKHRIVTLTPRDAELESMSGETLSKTILKKVSEAIEKYRSLRTPEALYANISNTVVGTIVFLFIVYIIHIVMRFMRNRVVIFSKRLRKRLKMPPENISPPYIRRLLLELLLFFEFIAILHIVYLYLSFSLYLFPQTRVYALSFHSFMVRFLWRIWGNFIGYMPNLFVVSTFVFIAFAIYRILGALFEAVRLENIVIPGFYAQWATPTRRIVRGLILIFTLIICYPYLPGGQSPAFQGISVFVGILLSLGSTSLIGNYLSGIALIYARAYEVGDWVLIGEYTGDVIERGALATRIRTVKNREITIPNIFIINNPIQNYSMAARAAPIILSIEISLSYDYPHETISELLVSGALNTRDILEEPAPFVLQTQLDDNYVRYEINAYTRNVKEIILIRSELNRNIHNAFDRAGMEILSPTYHSLRNSNTTNSPPA